MEVQVEGVERVAGERANSFIITKGDGFYYHVQEFRGNRVRLRCRKYSSGCRATASINFVTEEWRQGHHQHSHEADPLLLQDMDMRRAIIADARSNRFGVKLRAILNDHKVRNPDLARRFTTARMHSALYVARSQNYPAIPKTLIHLGILLGLPDMSAVCRTVDGTDYIFRGIVGCVALKTTSILFASGRMLHHLQTCTNLHGDGTFRKRPRKPNCIQIYNIVTRFGSTIISLVRVIMMKRTTASYNALFEYIKVLAPNLQPDRIHCDFELAQMNAWKQAFPESEIVGCLWHYGVALSSHARKLGLAILSKENDMVHTFIRCLGGLPLLPRHQIWEGVLQLWEQVEASGWSDDLGPLFDYFKRIWRPRINELSVFGFPERTNNCSESDNSMLGNVVPQNRPNVWHLIGGFVQLEHLSWSDKLAVQDGLPVVANRRWKAIANDARVRRLSALLEAGEMTPCHFLHACSWVNVTAVNHGLKLQADSESDSSDDSSVMDSSDDNSYSDSSDGEM